MHMPYNTRNLLAQPMQSFPMILFLLLRLQLGQFRLSLASSMLQLLGAYNCILSNLHDVLSEVVTGQESAKPGVNENEFLTPFISGNLLPDHGYNTDYAWFLKVGIPSAAAPEGSQRNAPWKRKIYRNRMTSYYSKIFER